MSPGIKGSDDIAELQRQLLLESSHFDSSASTRVSLDDVSSFVRDSTHAVPDQMFITAGTEMLA